MMVCATVAGTLVLRRKFDPVMVARDVAEHDADILAAVPSMLHRMLEAPAADLSSLRITATSGSALPGELAVRWMDSHGDTLHNVYGSTEVGQVSVAGPTDLRAAPGTAGRPIRGVDLRIVDSNGQTLPAGHDGRIVVASAMHFDGYTGGGSKPMVDGHMEIGDRGRIDADGRLFVLGRADDMIISGGENLYPSLIERSILAEERVTDVAVVGVDDADLGQRVRAVVVPRARTRTAALTTDLRERLADELARHEIPREFVYVDELPRNLTGKILRNRLDGDIESIPHRKPTKESM
jgi:fatty-acyl-CoA synthase